MPDIILGNLPAATTPLTGAERVPMDQRVGGSIAATALTPGLGYVIVTLGSTNWTVCGVPAGVTPVVGLVFSCSAVGTGTGTAQQVETVDVAVADIAALAPATNLSYDASTRLLSSSTGTDVTLPLATTQAAGLVPALAGGTGAFLRSDGTWATPSGGATDLSYDASTRLLSSSTGGDVTLPLVTTQAAGLVPTLAGGTGTFLRADGTWAAPPGGATDLSYDPATRLLSSSTGGDVTLPLAGSTTAGLLPPTNDPLTLASLAVTGTLTAPHIHGAMAGPLYIHVRNNAGVSLPAGSPVHVVGNQGDTDRMLVVLARADDPDTLPANGILLETLAPSADGHAVNVGELTGFNTSGLTAGGQVFVAPTGGLTMTITGSAVQAIATVGRVHATTGSILVNASPVLSPVAFSGAYGALSGRPNLAPVATSGAYGDLSGRPPEISQADAEAGSATVFSLWSAQRWRQAAATWWQSFTSAMGRSLVGAADAPAARTVLGLGTAAPLDVAASGNASTSQVVRGDDTRLSDARTPTAHTQAANTISDSTATGRAVLTAADAPAARTVLGLGTAAPLDVAASGNASTSQVVRGDDTRLSDARTPTAHTQAAGTISDSTTVGRAVLTAASAAAGRAALGLETVADRFAPVITLTAVGGIFTVDVPNTSAARIELGTIAGNVTILLANGVTAITTTTVANIPADTAWSAEFGFTYTSGTITWISGSNTGISRVLQTLDFGANGGPTLTAGKVYTVLMSHTRSSSSVLWWVVGAQP